MYYNDYEDYMRSVLGYSNSNENTYCNSCNYGMNYNDMDYNNSNYRDTTDSNIERMYPEIYKIINPMVCRICDNNTEPVTEYLIEQMTDDIYDNVVNRVEVQNVINLNIGTREIDETLTSSARENRGDLKENRETKGSINVSTNSNNINKAPNITNKNTSTNLKQSDLINTNNNRSVEPEERELRSPSPRRRNRLLRDLIRILLLNRLIRPGRPRPNRPPFRPGPVGPRPPMPGGPGFRPRPPMPRYDYEW